MKQDKEQTQTHAKLQNDTMKQLSPNWIIPLRNTKLGKQSKHWKRAQPTD